MEDIAVFVRRYGGESVERIRYAGAADPQNPPNWRDKKSLLEDDPNLSFRNELLNYLLAQDSTRKNRYNEASNELVHDLFVAHWEFAVSHDCCGIEELATQVLQRDLYSTFVQAWTLPLGMDQGAPLEVAIARVTKIKGRTPLSAVLSSIDERLESEKNPAITERLERWRSWAHKRAQR